MSHRFEEECSWCDGVFKHTNSSLSGAESGKEGARNQVWNVGRGQITMNAQYQLRETGFLFGTEDVELAEKVASLYPGFLERPRKATCVIDLRNECRKAV